MARSFLIAVLGVALTSLPAFGANCPANPYTLTNGATADATQVMANFNNLLTCANSSLAPIASPSFSGNVGIQATSPGELLTLDTSATVASSNIQQYNYAYLGSDYSSWTTILGSNVRARHGANPGMELGSNFTLNGASAIRLNFNSIEFDTASASNISGYSDGTPFSFPRITIDSSGDLGLATTTPQGLLSVASTGISGHATPFTNWSNKFSVFGPNAGAASGAALGLGYDTTDDAGAIVSVAPNVNWKPLYFNAASYSFYDAGAVAVTITSAGSVGIGTASPARTLTVVGNIRVGTSGSNGCVENFAGSIIAGTACSSDGALKTLDGNVTNILEKFANLQLVRFHWNKMAAALYRNATTVPNTGFIAQSVELQFPELVSIDAHGYRQLDYTTLSLYGLEAIKELKLANDKQAAEIAVLNARLVDIQARLAVRLKRRQLAGIPQGN